MTALLEVAGLRHAFGGVQAVADVTFGVREGTITGLIGPNGAGKSTVINVVGGQLRPDGGRVRFAGEDIQGSAPPANARRGIVRTFQTPRLFEGLTVLENLLLGVAPWPGESLRAAVLGRRSWRRAEAAQVDRARGVLARFEMIEYQHAYAGTLSGGQKRIAELMRALMAGPRLLLLDEPMAGVNPATAGRIADLLARLRADGTTMLMIDHDLALVERLCDPVVVMAQGRVLAEGPLALLRADREVQEAYLAG